MAPSKILFWLCIIFISGIACASFVKIPQAVLWGIFAVGFLAISLGIVLLVKSASWRGLRGATVIWWGFCLWCAVLGIARFQVSTLMFQYDTVRKINDRPETIVLAGTLIAVPDVRGSFQKLKVKIDGTNSIVLAVVRPNVAYHYMDKVRVSGTLETPFQGEEFSYKDYLMKDGIYSAMSFPDITLITRRARRSLAAVFHEAAAGLKASLEQSMNKNFRPPYGAVLHGIILGDDSNMPKGVKDIFKKEGLSHLTALSGSNIIIASTIFLSFLVLLGFWRQQAAYAAIGFAWLYVAVAAFPSSGVRAGIMTSILLFSQAIGRQNASWRAIMVAAALMLLHNPRLLRYDAGFQLSFAASFGIIHLKPLIDGWVQGAARRIAGAHRALRNMASAMPEFPKARAKKLWEVFSVTLSAQVFALPIVAYHFKQVSFIAPITNLLVVPMVDWLMVLGLLSAVLGIASNFLGWVLALPCLALLHYLFKVLDAFNQPWAGITVQKFHWMWLGLYYAACLAAIVYVQKHQNPKFLEF